MDMKLKLLIFLLVFQFSFSQEEQEIDFNLPRNYIEISEALEPYVEEFILEAQERGFYVRSYLMEKIDYIYLVDNIPNNKLGFVGEDKRGFYVSSSIDDSEMKLRLTVFHEIGHILKNTGEHSCFVCYDIMSEHNPNDLSVYEDDLFWEEKLNNYFEWLNGK